MIKQMINLSYDQSNPPTPKTTGAALSAREQQEVATPLLNVSGVLNGFHFLLIGLLVSLSMASVWTRTDNIHQHQRYLRMYFNLNLLGLDNQGLYEDSDNIDQSQTEFQSYSDMCRLLRQLVNVTNSYGEDGVVAFEIKDADPIVTIESVTLNGTLGLLQFYDPQEALDYFDNFTSDKTRDLLLSTSSVIVSSRLGDSKFAHNYSIVAQISIHNKLMLQAVLEYEYQGIKPRIAKKIQGLRILEQIVAAALFFLFLHRLVVLRQEQSNDILMGGFRQTVKLKYMKWYLFLVIMNLVVLSSWKMTPMGAWLQLLPLLEFPQKQEDDRTAFNFNKNIRFSLPLILRIWLPLLLFLNGFIYFSMLMYANSDSGYFSNYFYSFFDYMYQMFQVGTYQIFTEMQQYGYWADILYAFLYFYVFEMGTTLIPAFFVTLIQLKINQKEIAVYSHNLLKAAVCPACHSNNNYDLDTHTLQIMVTSPKLAPLVKDTRLLHSPKVNSSLESKGKGGIPISEIKLYIEDFQQESSTQRKKFKIHEGFVSLSKKIQGLLRQIEVLSDREKDKPELKKILALLNQYQLSYPRRSP